jgi:hypothetical protein
MSNRTLAILTGLVLLGMILLFAINLTNILTGRPPNQRYLQYNNIRGIAVSHNQLLYTLNFQQQNEVIDILNVAVPVIEIKPGKRQQPNIDKMIIYQFEGKPEITITPIAFVDQDLIFSAHAWEPHDYLMELSEGDLHKLLSQSYDP